MAVVSRTYTRPPVLFPNPPENSTPEFIEYHRKVKEYIDRLMDFLRDSIKSNGDITTITGGGGGSILASGKVQLVSGSKTISTPFAALSGVTYLLTREDEPFGGNTGSLRINGIVGGSSFTVSSTDGADGGYFWWAIFSS